MAKKSETYFEEKADKLIDRLNKNKTYLSKKDIYDIKYKIATEKIYNNKQLDKEIMKKEKSNPNYYEIQFEKNKIKLQDYYNKKTENSKYIYDSDDFDDKVAQGVITKKSDVDKYLQGELR